MDFRKTFDKIPEEFDKFRPRYCAELFRELAQVCELNENKRVLDAEEFCSYIGTHCEHIDLEEPYRAKFYRGIREVILKAGDKITLVDTIPLYLVQKPV